MRSQRFLEAVGVQATRTFVTNGAEAVDLLLSGRGDVAMQIGFGPALKAIARGAPLRIVAASNLLTVHAIYSKQPEIRRLSDLAGRTVGTGAFGALTHQLIYAALTKHGVDPKNVRFVPMGNSASIFQALLRDEIDAGFGETEVFDHQVEYGVHALEDAVLWRELPEFPNQASFATLEAVRDRREALVHTLAGHALLYRYLQAPQSWPAFATARAAALPDSDPSESPIQWKFYQDYKPFAQDLQLPSNKLDYLQQLNVRMGLQSHVLPYDSVADMSLAHEALRLLDTSPNSPLFRPLIDD
jgi:ABC-type nitrate/sulfonate/bicarbonate transport system substrate-binding protein